ncbi:MAG: ABC transporter permease [Clostridiales bacterium]
MIIFKYAMFRIFKNKIKIAILLFAPIIFIIVFATDNAEVMKLGIVDNDKTILSKTLVENLQSTEAEIIHIEEDEVIDKSVSHVVKYALVIDDGFEYNITKGNGAKIKEFYATENEKLYIIRSQVDNFIYNMKSLAHNSNYNKENFDKLLELQKSSKLGYVNNNKDIQEKLKAEASLSILIFFMLYMSVITAGIILEDKVKGTFTRIFYSSMSLKNYIFQNLIAFFLIGFIQVSVIFIFFKTVSKVSFSENSWSMYILFIIFAMLCISLGIWLISIFKKPLQVYVAIVFITSPLSFLGGVFYPPETMPDIMQKIGLFVPTTWLMKGVRKIMYDGYNITNLGPEILILVLFIGIFLTSGMIRKTELT